jgi:hypothetical protein
MAVISDSRFRPVGVLLSKVPRWPIQLASLIIAFSFFLPGLKKVPCWSLNCAVCPAMVFGCHVRFFQDAVVSRLPALYSLGILAAVGALIGSLSCGWFCPFGLLQDWYGLQQTSFLPAGLSDWGNLFLLPPFQPAAGQGRYESMYTV